jgi:DNA repair protein RecN (Recombination protein N)
MLRQLSVQNFAIVDRVDLEFEPGFNVLTGETGAGKSLLVDALYFLLGERLDPAMLRAGEEKASAEALFQVRPGSPALAKIAEWGLTAYDGEILLRREYTRSSGKTRSTVNGSMATAAMAAELADLLVDLHGQHEHQAIFNVSRHRRLVDVFGSLEKKLEETARTYRDLSGLLEEQARLGGDSRDTARRQDLLTFQVEELETAGLEDLEEEVLNRDYQSAKHAGKVAEFLTSAQEALEGGVSGGCTGLQGTVCARLRDAAKLDPSLEALADQAQAAQESINQLSFEVSRRLETASFSDDDLQALTDRIDQVHNLKKKYGDTLAEVRSYLEKARAELSDLQNREGRLKALDQDIKKAAEAYRLAGEVLSVGRQKAGAQLAVATRKLLGDLGLSGAKLEVNVVTQEQPGSPVLQKGKFVGLSAAGWDHVEFQFSANPGEPLRPLAKVASGGEASRIMLALKAVLAGADDVDTLVFDEIDTGVGARTASAVGKVMERLSSEKQVLCISHLAPLAGLGRTHLRVLKEVRDGKTFTRVEWLSGDERIEELARMLGGEPVTEVSRRHAVELMKLSKS